MCRCRNEKLLALLSQPPFTPLHANDHASSAPPSSATSHALVAPPRVQPRRLHLSSTTTETKGDSVTETLARIRANRRRGRFIIAGFRKCVDTLHGDVFFKGLKFDVCAKDPKFVPGPVVGALIVGKALQGGKTVAQLKAVTGTTTAEETGPGDARRRGCLDAGFGLLVRAGGALRRAGPRANGQPAKAASQML